MRFHTHIPAFFMPFLLQTMLSMVAICPQRPFKCPLKVVSKKVCKLDIILIFALSNKKQQEYGTYTRTNFGNYFELHK